MSIEIRKAAASDADTVIRFIHALAEYEKLGGPTKDGEERIREYGWGAQPRFEVLLAFKGDVPVGFAFYFYTFSTFAARPTLFLEDLFVHPEYRGRGYGKALLSALAEEAVANGCARMDWMVLDWNETAIDFYRALGATVMPEWELCRLSGEPLRALGDSGNRSHG